MSAHLSPLGAARGSGMSGLTLRPATHADIDAIARIEAAQQRNGHAVAFAAMPASDAQKQAAVLKLVTAYRANGVVPPISRPKS